MRDKYKFIHTAVNKKETFITRFAWNLNSKIYRKIYPICYLCLLLSVCIFLYSHFVFYLFISISIQFSIYLYLCLFKYISILSLSHHFVSINICSNLLSFCLYLTVHVYQSHSLHICQNELVEIILSPSHQILLGNFKYSSKWVTSL